MSQGAPVTGRACHRARLSQGCVKGNVTNRFPQVNSSRNSRADVRGKRKEFAPTDATHLDQAVSLN